MGLFDDWFGYESPSQKARKAQDKAAAAEKRRIKKLEEEQAAAVEVTAKEQESMESWTWAQKYLQTQRQVAQAKAAQAEKQKMLPEPTTKPVETETIEKIKEIAIPAAGVGLVFWLFK